MNDDRQALPSWRAARVVGIGEDELMDLAGEGLCQGATLTVKGWSFTRAGLLHLQRNLTQARRKRAEYAQDRT